MEIVETVRERQREIDRARERKRKKRVTITWNKVRKIKKKIFNGVPMRTMVATNQRDYATISHTDMTDSPDKSSCRSATINNNIWMPAGGTAGATLLHLTRSFASRVAQHTIVRVISPSSPTLSNAWRFTR